MPTDKLSNEMLERIKVATHSTDTPSRYIRLMAAEILELRQDLSDARNGWEAAASFLAAAGPWLDYPGHSPERPGHYLVTQEKEGCFHERVILYEDRWHRVRAELHGEVIAFAEVLGYRK